MTEDQEWWKCADVIEVGGVVRSSSEERFRMRTERCHSCGTYGYVMIKAFNTMSRGESVCFYRVACQTCGEERRYRFVTTTDSYDPPERSPEYGRLGRPGSTSTVIPPSSFARELVRNEVALREEHARGEDENDLRRTSDAMRCLEELTNFLGDRDEIPASEDPGEVAARHEHPEWFTRAWIEAQWPYWRAEREAAVAAKAVRNAEWERQQAEKKLRLTADGMPPMVPPLTNASFVLHRGWLAKELGGQRLRAIDTRAEGERIRSQDFTRAQLTRTHLTRAEIVACKLDEAELVEVFASDAMFDRSTFADTVLARCVFVRARFDHARLGGVRATGCDFQGARLARANLDTAAFEDCDLRDAILADATSDVRREVSFVRCDLRGARWRGGTLAQCRFVDCHFGELDAPVTLLHTTFEGCLLDGAPITAADLEARWSAR